MTTKQWLHTPRTIDYRHSRQDRWIQTELAFTLGKNATKPNSFEIVPRQTTRKENNWKTEEALARAAVTLETERIKGSNPWCLWWWWLSLVFSIMKGKAVPLQAWSSPEGSRKLRFSDFMKTAQDGGKVVSLMHRLPLPPGNTSGTHFF